MEATKQRYSRPDSVKILESLADAEARRLHPGNPGLCPRKFKDNTANHLTRCICEYIRLRGGFASRINNQGTYLRKLGRYIPTTSRKGLPDVLATYKSRSLFIEVKYGAELVLELEDYYKDKAKEKESQRKSTKPILAKSDLPIMNVREELARKAGVSHGTIDKVKTGRK